MSDLPPSYPPPPPPPGVARVPGAVGKPPLPRSMLVRRIVALSVLVVIVVVVAVLAWNSHKSSPDSAKVGDCVSHSGGDSIKVVGCADASAAYKVVGKVGNKTQPAFDLDSEGICRPFAGTVSAFWKGEIGKTGYVLCLGHVR